MILVSGGNGNIGRKVCEGLVERGYEVISIGRRKMDFPGYRHVSCDVTSEEDLDRLFKENDIDMILHLAGLTNTAAKKDPLSAVKINIDGSVGLMRKAIEYHIPLFYGSSVNAVGLPAKKGSYKEGDMCVPQEYYGWTKRFTEETGLALADTQGLDFTSLRIPSVLGRGQGSVNTPWRETIFSQVGLGGDLMISYHRDSLLPAVHIDDLVNAICAVMTGKGNRRRVYNLPAEQLKIDGLVEMLEEIDPSLNITTGEVLTTGMCSDIDWSAFREDYPIEIKTIKERLLEAREKNWNEVL